MGKLLKIVAYVFLILGIVALVFGTMLFNKRELLKGRTQKLETAVIQLGTFIEDQAAEPQPVNFPAKDISDCTADVLDSPERSDFWRQYPAHLEQQNLPTMDMAQRKSELMSYYLLDPVTLKVMRDESGFKVTSGKGTMQGVLDEQIAKAEEQLKRLNETRKHLQAVREELVKTIEELNTRKGALRVTLRDKARLEAKVAEIEGALREKDQQLAELTEQKRVAEEQAAVQKQQIAQLEEDIADNKAEIQRLQKIIKERTSQEPARFGGKIEPGVKGKVLSVDANWNFAILDLDEDFLKAILGEEMQNELPIVELLVRRPGTDGPFVTKVRLFQVKREQRLGIADVLTDWQQQPVQEGDIVYF
mgnify:CR=1 FL=1